MKLAMVKAVSIIGMFSMIILCTGFYTDMSMLYAQGGEKIESQNVEQHVSQESENVSVNAESTKEEQNAEQSVFLYDWFRRGGFFMWPVLLAAALAMGLIIERFLFYRKANLKPDQFLEEINQRIENGSMEDVISLCNDKDMVISRILLKGLNLRKLGLDHVEKGISAAGSIEVASLEKGLSVLSAIGNIAPLIGFLGTVSGMISAFQSIAAADQVSARLVAGGIYEALITTEAGLIVAIPVLAFYNFFIHRIETFVADIERLSSEIAEKMLGENGQN